MEKLLIIDGNSILNRAFYAVRMLNAPDGTPTNAVYGFLNILFKYLEEETPDYLCVAFDVKAKTFRHEMYEQYKAHRKPAPAELIEQMPVIKDVLRAMNIFAIEKEGYEADDIIGTVSRLCDSGNIECSILTGDKDDLQLASDLTKIKLVVTRGGKTETTAYTKDTVMEVLGVTPAQFIDVKALMGDPSDNIPGVAGIGEKTAFSLIKDHGSLDKIYENIDNLGLSDSLSAKLKDGRDIAYLSRKLSEIVCDVPIELSFDNMRYSKDYDKQELAGLFTKLNFKTFISKLDLQSVPVKEKAKAAESVDHDIPKDGIEVTAPQAVFGLVTESKRVFYKLYKGVMGYSVGITADGKNIYLIKDAGISVLKYIFESPEIQKVGYNIKDDIVALSKIGIQYEGIGFDVLVAAYISEPSRSSYSMEEIAFSHLGMDLSGRQAVVEQAGGDGQLSMLFGDKPASVPYVGEIAAIMKLHNHFALEIKRRNQTELYYSVELPLIKILADMQIAGVCVDKSKLIGFGEKLSVRLDELKKDIYEVSEEEFNINSPKQLGVILFEKLGLPVIKKTKTGYSTDVEVLQKLMGASPIIEALIEYRQLSKLESTYVEGLLSVINPVTRRVHSTFNQTVTATGRISSTEPNMQNIPVRHEVGRELRRVFVAQGEDKILVDADYSQIELRVLAHISGDESMRSAFLQDVDIHTLTASQIFQVPAAEVDSRMRTRAKAVNFGIIYGIGDFSLSQDLGITKHEAAKYIDEYLRKYPMVKKFMTDSVEYARKHGYVETILHRRRYIPEINDGNKIRQAFGERVAMNAPIQGSAADIIKIAMVNVYNQLLVRGLRSKLILQVHDELIVEAHIDELEEVENILKYEMENAVKLSVPLVVDMKHGADWYSTK